MSTHGRRTWAACRCEPGSVPEYGEALSHRVAKHLGKARDRIRIASPVLTSGPILATLVEIVNEGRCDVAGIIDDTQVDQVFGQWKTNGVSAWKIPLLRRILEGASVQRQGLDALEPGVRERLHACEGRRRRRHVVRRQLQLLPFGRAKRGERARDSATAASPTDSPASSTRFGLGTRQPRRPPEVTEPWHDRQRFHAPAGGFQALRVLMPPQRL